jgi:hypothetical protein
VVLLIGDTARTSLVACRWVVRLTAGHLTCPSRDREAGTGHYAPSAQRIDPVTRLGPIRRYARALLGPPTPRSPSPRQRFLASGLSSVPAWTDDRPLGHWTTTETTQTKNARIALASGRFCWSNCVVRGRVELPTFRFSVLRTTVRGGSPTAASPAQQPSTTASALPCTPANETETETRLGPPVPLPTTISSPGSSPPVHRHAWRLTAVPQDEVTKEKLNRYTPTDSAAAIESSDGFHLQSSRLPSIRIVATTVAVASDTTEGLTL